MSHSHRPAHKRRGFTIVELVIVIAVIGILATVLVPTFGDIITKAQDSKAKQQAKNAYTQYITDHAAEGTPVAYMLYEADGRFVALEHGAATGVYRSQAAALTAMLDDPDTLSYDESECFDLRETGSENLYYPHRTKVIYHAANLTRLPGAVSSVNGTIENYSNNWYAEIAIPQGARQVRFLTFQTGNQTYQWGSDFLNGTVHLSGVSDLTTGGQWVTVDIPEQATTFRYGYLYDTVAEGKGYPAFEYLEFLGENIQEAAQGAQKMERPATGQHAFSVQVDIAPALGQASPVMATDYGYISLPENYTADGEPTRLVIVCHGAGAKLAYYQSASPTAHSQTYWLDMGYAIMDMFACPPALGNNSELHYGNPTVLECYEKGYAYVMDRFNLYTDGVFVLGSSMGGLSSFQIVQSEKFPVLAQVANCPVIDLFKQAYCNPWADTIYQRERISSYFGFDSTKPAFTTTKHTPSQTEIDYFRNNFDRVIPYSPIFANVTAGDRSAIFGKLPANATVADAEEAALYAGLTATHPCPLLIIHNKNDATVSYRYSEYLYGMLDRGDADVTLKLYDTGAHEAWNNGPEGQIENHAGEMVTLRESKRLAIEFFRQYEP